MGLLQVGPLTLAGNASDPTVISQWAAQIAGSVNALNNAVANAAQQSGLTLNTIGDGTTRFAANAVDLSYRPLSNPLSATGTTINVASFTMLIGGLSVNYNSGSVSGLSASTLYYVYFDDPTKAGGTVVYQATVTKETAIAGRGRFFLGSITTPQAGAGNTTIGNNDGGVGAQTGGTTTYLFSIATPTASGGGVVSNPNNAIDASLTTFCALSTSGAGQIAKVTLSGLPSVAGNWTSATLYALVSGTVGSASEIDGILTVNGTPYTIFDTTTPGAIPLTTEFIAIPLPVNLSQVSVSFLINESSGTNSSLDVFSAWIALIQ